MTATSQLLTLLGHIGDWKVWLPVFTSNYRLTNDGVKLGSRGRVSSAQLMEENVALKDLNPNSTFISCRRQDWQKFILELKHEHVVSYLCATYSFRDFQLVMELCCNATMKDVYLKNDRALADDLLLETLSVSKFMKEIAEGLQYLHSRGVIHGRLTLDRILLWKKQPHFHPIVKLCGHVPHTVPQLPMTDLNSLGVTFYSMTTGDLVETNVEKILTVSSTSLVHLEENRRFAAKQMIDHLLDEPSANKIESVDELMSCTFMTTNFDCSLTEANLTSVTQFENWFKGLDSTDRVSFEKSHEALSQVLMNSADDTCEMIGKAFKEAPDLWARYVWHLSQLPPLVQTNLVIGDLPELGSGSYGTVRSGLWTTEEGKSVPAAFKIFKVKTNVESLIKEWEALRRLDHLFIVKCYATCTIQSYPCVVMELCFGSLKDLVTNELEGILNPPPDKKILLGQVTLGLAHIHSLGMIHKDLKPDNILLWRASVDSNLVLAKITDFGFAKQVRGNDANFSCTSHPGTFGYMAPELLEKLDRNEKEVTCTRESDAFALGITIAYTLLDGEHPYGSRVLRDVLILSGSDPILIGNLAWDATDLILSLTKKDPTQRASLGLVIYHPYFSLANPKTKANFADKFDKYCHLLPNLWYDSNIFYEGLLDDYENEMKQNYQQNQDNNLNVYHFLTQQYDSNLEPIRETLSHLESCRQYFAKIQHAIEPKGERGKNAPLQGSSTRQTERSNDWTVRMQAKLDENPTLISFCYMHLRRGLKSATFFGTRNHKAGYSKIEGRLVDYPSKEGFFKFFQMSEMTFGFLFYEDVKDQMDLWNLKTSRNPPSRDQDFLDLISDLPFHASPLLVIEQLCRGLSNINAVDEKNKTNTTILHWMLDNRWARVKSGVNLVLGKEVDPNLRDKFGRTAIHLAARNRTEDGPSVVRLLLSKGGDPNMFDKIPETPIHLAVQNESIYGKEILKLLLEAGGNPNSQLDGDGMELTSDVYGRKASPMHYAAMNKSSEALAILQTLLDHGGDPNLASGNDQTPVHRAAENESRFGPDLLRLLLDSGGNPHVKCVDGKMPIHLIAQNSTVGWQSLQVLLDRDESACVNQPSKLTRITPLHYVARNVTESGLKMMKVFLDRNWDPNCRTYDRKTPLSNCTLQTDKHSARIQLQMVQLLVDRGGHLLDLHDEIAPLICWLFQQEVTSEHSSFLRHLYTRHGKPNLNYQHCDEEWSPLHYAAQHQVEESDAHAFQDGVEFLLEKGADPNLADRRGKTPMHWAAMNRSPFGPSILRLFLDYGGNLEVTDNLGDSPIQLIVKNGSVDTVNFILESGYHSNTPLIHFSALNPTLSMMKHLVTNGFDLTTVDQSGKTVLHYAARNDTDGGPEIVQFLLENKLDPNAQDLSGETPLHLAATYLIHQLDGVRSLLQHGADPNIADHKDKTSVHRAVTSQSELALNILKLLLEYDGSRNLCDQQGKTPIQYVAEKGKPDQMDILLGNDFDPSDKSTISLLFLSALNRKETMIKLLVQKGLDVNAVDESRRTALHHAAKNDTKGGPKIVQFLLDCNLDPRAKDKDGLTPFHYAIRELRKNLLDTLLLLLENLDSKFSSASQPTLELFSSSLIDWGSLVKKLITSTGDHSNSKGSVLQVLRLLLDNGVDPNAESNGMTPIHTLLESYSRRDLKIMELLLKKGANPNLKRRSDGQTAVHRLAIDDRCGFLELVLKYDGDPNALDDCQLSPIDYALRLSPINGYPCLLLLLRHGGNLNYLSDSGTTWLHFATENLSNQSESVYKKRLEILKCLLAERNCDPNVRDHLGRTPLHLAALHSNKWVIATIYILFEHGGDLMRTDHQGETPVCYAAKYNHQMGNAILQNFAFQKDFDHEAKYESGKTLLHYAVETQKFHPEQRWGYALLKELLLKHCDVNPTDDFGRTPLHLAASNTTNWAIEMCSLLLKYGANLDAIDNQNRRPFDHARDNQNLSNREKLMQLFENSG